MGHSWDADRPGPCQGPSGSLGPNSWGLGGRRRTGGRGPGWGLRHPPEGAETAPRGCPFLGAPPASPPPSHLRPLPLMDSWSRVGTQRVPLARLPPRCPVMERFARRGSPFLPAARLRAEPLARGRRSPPPAVAGHDPAVREDADGGDAQGLPPAPARVRLPR